MTRDDIERRWATAGEAVLALARRDAVLNALLYFWVRRPELDLPWVAQQYLGQRWMSVETMLTKMAPEWVERWRAQWPAWSEPAPILLRDNSDELRAEHARGLIARALHLYEGQFRLFGRWLELQPPPGLVELGLLPRRKP